MAATMIPQQQRPHPPLRAHACALLVWSLSPLHELDHACPTAWWWAFCLPPPSSPIPPMLGTARTCRVRAWVVAGMKASPLHAWLPSWRFGHVVIGVSVPASCLCGVRCCLPLPFVLAAAALWCVFRHALLLSSLRCALCCPGCMLWLLCVAACCGVPPEASALRPRGLRSLPTLYLLFTL